MPKALGIEMGVPYWEVRSLLEEHKVQAFSSNYALYGDMSARAMDTLQQHCAEVEVYSIDEAFLRLSFHKQDLQQYGEQLRRVKELKGEACYALKPLLARFVTGTEKVLSPAHAEFLPVQRIKI